jgi:hypothetical protein
MTFESDYFQSLIPPYLSVPDKQRLIEALKQFKSGDKARDWHPKFYTGFYLLKQHPYFLQGDLVREIRYPYWDVETRTFEKKYADAIIITNTCDMDGSNTRTVQKQVLFAPIVPFETFRDELARIVEAQELAGIEQRVKEQLYSNVFYLPPVGEDQIDFIVPLDEVFWLPGHEFQTYTADIEQNRIASLDWFGFMLFVLKLSYHLCRLPEDLHR